MRTDQDDAELVAAVRAGDQSAFDVLFRRHYGPACDFANRLAGQKDGSDRVAEGFARVYRQLAKGQGPDTNFRAYLYTSIRNAHLDAVRRSPRESSLDDGVFEVPAADDVEGEVLAKVDVSPIRRAFASLRPTWQTVLWHSVVLGESHEEVAQRIGSNPNAVGVLAFRAREGLRQAYLAEHLNAATDAACRALADRLPSYVRGQLNANRSEAVAQHLVGCDKCQVAARDLEQINTNLNVILTPAVVISVVAAGHGAGFLGGAAGSASGTGAAGGTVAAKVALAGVAGAAAVAVGIALFAGSAPSVDPTPQAAPPLAVSSALPVEEPATLAPLPSRIPTPEAPTSTPAAPPPTPTSSPSVPAPKPSEVPSLPEEPVVEPGLSQPRVTTGGSTQLKQARVTLEATPGDAQTLTATVSNVSALAITSPGLDCGASVIADGTATVRCAVRPGITTFTVALSLTFAEPSSAVSGQIALSPQGARGLVRFSA